jgi:hypothetical protein
MTKKIELFTPAERAKRNARMGIAIGKCLGFGLLAVTVSLVAGICAVREAWRGVDYGPDPDRFVSSLFKRSAEMARRQRERQLKGEINDD